MPGIPDHLLPLLGTTEKPGFSRNRLIYLWKSGEMKIYLLVAYFRGERGEISKKAVESLLGKLKEELG